MLDFITFWSFSMFFPAFFTMAPWASFSDRNVIFVAKQWCKDKSQEAQWRGTAVPLLLQAQYVDLP
jgi:hypothetical protein